MIYDVIIIGAGPAGLSAGIYAARSKVNTLLIEKAIDGGQIVGTADIENYPGTVLDETGFGLIEKMKAQLNAFGADKVYEDVVDVDLEGEIKTVKTNSNEYKAKSVIIATGTRTRLMGSKGEQELIGRGISLCATCDGPFYEGYHVYVIGGGDAAVEEAIFLTRYAKEVTIVHRRDELRATKIIQERAFANEKINFIWDSEVEEVSGENGLECITLKNRKTGEISNIVSSDENKIGIFVFIGLDPNTELFKGKLKLNEKGYIPTNENMETEIPGVYAVGDVREKELRQVVTATADGAIAAVRAEKYINS